jgi:hypothetical protein
MTHPRIQFHRGWFRLNILLLVLSLMGCQSIPALVPTPTFPSTATVTPGSSLGEAPPTLVATSWPPIEAEILSLFDYDPLEALAIQEVSVTELNTPARKVDLCRLLCLCRRTLQDPLQASF